MESVARRTNENGAHVSYSHAYPVAHTKQKHATRRVRESNERYGAAATASLLCKRWPNSVWHRCSLHGTVRYFGRVHVDVAGRHDLSTDPRFAHHESCGALRLLDP